MSASALATQHSEQASAGRATFVGQRAWKPALDALPERLRAPAKESEMGDTTSPPRPMSPLATTARPIGRQDERVAKVEALQEAMALPDQELPTSQKFRSEIEWEGYVTAIADDEILAVVRQIGDQDQSEHTLEIPINLLGNADRKYLAKGAIFRLSVGATLKYKRKHLDARFSITEVNDAQLYFRRHRMGSRSAREAMREGARMLAQAALGIRG